MKLRYLFWGYLAIALHACNWGLSHNTPAGISKVTLAFTQKTIIKKSGDDTIVNISYPEFKGQKALNDSITQKLVALLQIDDYATNSGLDAYTEGFIKDYQQDKLKYPDAQTYSLHTSAKIARQDSSLITIIVGGYAFQSGARGFSATRFINWDRRTGKNLQLQDIFQKSGYDKLVKVADTIFRKEEKLSDTASLAKNYFFPDHKFGLNNNFLITPTGLHFLYNEGEIKAVTANQTEIVIPYTKIKSLLLPHTVIAQYIK